MVAEGGWAQATGADPPWEGGFFSRGWKCSGMRQWRWLFDIANVLKALELYTRD